MNKTSTCIVVVISNPTVYDVCVFHAAVFGERNYLRAGVSCLIFLKAELELNLACKLNLC